MSTLERNYRSRYSTRRNAHVQHLLGLACVAVVSLAVGFAGAMALVQQAHTHQPDNPLRCDALVDELAYYAGPEWQELTVTDTGQWCVRT